MNIKPEYIQELRDILPHASENTYAQFACAIQDSGVKLPSTLEQLHGMILQLAESEAVKFKPLEIDLEEYEIDRESYTTTRELAGVKVKTLAEVFEQSYLENFDEWLEQRSPLLTTTDSTLQAMTLQLLHKVKTLEVQRKADRGKVLLAIAYNTIRTWVVGVIAGLLLSNYPGFNFIKVTVFFGAISSILSPVAVFLESSKDVN